VFAAEGSAEHRGFGLSDAISVAFLLVIPVVLWWLWKKDVIRPGSFERPDARGRSVGSSPWSAWVLGAVGMFLAQDIAAAIGQLLAGVLDTSGASHEMTPRQQAVALLCGGSAGFLVGLPLLHFLGRAEWGRGAGLSIRPRGKDGVQGLKFLLLALPLVQGAGIAGALVSSLVTGQEPDELTHSTLRTIREHPWSAASWGMIVAAVAMAPIAEEILFRVLIQSSLLRLTGSVWGSILTTSVGFAAVHLIGGAVEVQALPALFVLGVGLGIAYERTGRVWVPIAMHMLFNAVNVAVTLGTS
jgi:membrane protease YdiL (CAAX protease family)